MQKGGGRVMARREEYRLKIDGFTVESLPMARLAEYMAELSRLLGEPERVHFSKMESGSAVLVSTIEDEAAPKVGERLRKVRDGTAPSDAVKAFRTLDALLAKDNAVATLTGNTSGEVIEFPGRTRPKPVRYGPFREEGSLEGMVIRVGGKGDTIPVWLKEPDGAEYLCQTSVEISEQIAPYYRKASLRVFGSGKWMREENGSWTLQEFDIDRFEVLDDSPLSEVVAKLRAVQGSEWSKDAQLGDMLGLRREEGSTH